MSITNQQAFEALAGLFPSATDGDGGDGASDDGAKETTGHPLLKAMTDKITDLFSGIRGDLDEIRDRIDTQEDECDDEDEEEIERDIALRCSCGRDITQQIATDASSDLFKSVSDALKFDARKIAEISWRLGSIEGADATRGSAIEATLGELRAENAEMRKALGGFGVWLSKSLNVPLDLVKGGGGNGGAPGGISLVDAARLVGTQEIDARYHMSGVGAAELSPGDAKSRAREDELIGSFGRATAYPVLAKALSDGMTDVRINPELKTGEAIAAVVNGRYGDLNATERSVLVGAAIARRGA